MVLKLLLKITAGLLAAIVLLVAAALAVVTIWPGVLQPTLEWALTPQDGRAEIQAVEFNPLRQSLSLRGLRISGPNPELLDVRAGQVMVRTDLLRALGGGPLLRMVKADGVEVVFTAQPGEGGGFDPALLGHLLAVDRLMVYAKSLDITTPQARLRVSGLVLNSSDKGKADLDLLALVEVAGPDGGQWFQGRLIGRGSAAEGKSLSGYLALNQGRLDTPWLAGEVLAGLNFGLQGDTLELKVLRFSLPDSTVSLQVDGRQLAWSGVKAHLALKGKYDLAKAEPNLETIGVAVDDILNISGSYSSEKLNAQAKLDCGGKLLKVLEPLLPQSLRGLGLQGILNLELTRSAEGLNELRLVPEGFRVSLPDGLVDAEFGGMIQLTGADDKLQWSGALTADASGRTGDLAVDHLQLKLPLAGPVLQPSSPRPELLAPAGSISWQGRILPLGLVSAAGEFVWQNDLPVLNNIVLKSETLGSLSGSAGMGPQGPSGALAGQNIAAGPILALVRAITPGKVDGWQASGGLDLDLSIKQQSGGPAVSVDLKPRDLGLQSADGLLMLAQLKGSFKAGIQMAAKPRFTAEMALGTGQLLYDTLYLDLSQRPLAVKAAGLRQGAFVWRDMLLDLRLGGMGSLRLSGALDASNKGKPVYSGHLSVKDFEIGPAFAELARPSLSARQPELGLMEIGGRADLGLDFKGKGSAAAISGRLAVAGGWLSPDGQAKTFQGLDLGLPFSYAMGGKGNPKNKPKQWGSLRLAKLEAGGVSLSGLKLTLALVPNRLIVKEAVSLPLYGAELRIKDLRVDQPLSPDFKANLDATLSKLDMASLPTGGMKLQGSLSGRLGPVVLTAKGLSCGGGLTGSFFGGKLRVSNIIARELFSGVPVFGADAQARSVDLKKLTTALGAGVVSGRVDIDLKGLRVASGQPQAFDLRVMSKETPGVDQEVSLQAVNSISVIGTGEGLTGLGMGLLQPLFERFAYEAIGFSCTLKTDVFTVRGLIRQGNVEYIVRKPVFFGINVINANKDNQISFSDMLERVRRVAADRAKSPEDEG